MEFSRFTIGFFTSASTKLRNRRDTRQYWRGRRLLFEALEPRIMLSGTPTINSLLSLSTPGQQAPALVGSTTADGNTMSKAGIAADASAAPEITNVIPSPTASQNWDFTIDGSNFGSSQGGSYVHIYDQTQNFNAGVPGIFGDAIDLAYGSWSSSQIIINGFSGLYNTLGTAQPGDTIQVTVDSGETSNTFTGTLPPSKPSTPGTP